MMGLSRLALYGLISTSLFSWTVLNAFRQRSNFYAAAVYLSKSNACTMILWNQGIFQTVLLGKALQAVFFGELRLIEIERLQERGWFAVTETLLALTIFKDEFESSFVMLFVSLLFFKVFHWLASDRVEMMEQTARVTRAAHARMIGLLSLLWVSDVLLLVYAVDSILFDGPTVMIMFASEYMILLANIWSTTAKYVINVIDMRREEPWEEKSIYVFYVELAADFFKLLTYLTFFGLILTFYGLPLNILRDVYITLRSFLLKIRDLRRYRQATRNMDTLYPNATREEMAQMTDKTCIICREDMEYRPAPGERVEGEEGRPQQEGEVAQQQQQQPVRGPNDTPKKLPCGHVFHFHCLRSWLERQQSCPTCRRPVLPQEQPQPPAGAAPGQPQQQPPPAAGAAGRPPVPPARDPRDAAADEAIRQAQINIARNLGREAFGVIFPDVPFPAEADPAGAGAAARLPRPPAAGGPTLAPPPVTGVNAANVPLPPSPLPTPTASTTAAAAPAPAHATPLAGPSTAATNPLLSPPTSATATAAAAIPPTPGAGNGAENPLARFSLPQLPVPQTGEAGLYHVPPTFAYQPQASPAPASAPAPAPAHGPPPAVAAAGHPGYSDVAYGAYPQFPHLGVAGGLPPPPGGSAQAQAAREGGMVNLEERVREVRRRWVGDGAAAQAQAEAKAEDEKEKGQGPSEEEKGKGKAVEADGDGEGAPEEEEKNTTEENGGDSTTEAEEGLSPREAALKAAERRANKGKGKERAAPESRPALVAHESNETVVPPPAPQAAASTSAPPAVAAEEAIPSSHPSPAAAAVPPSTAPPPLPRLIPLFDPSNPISAATLSLSYPHLFPPPPAGAPAPSSSSSAGPSPLLPDAPTREQSDELDRLTRAAVQERLRLLVGFQDRLEGLVEEMRGALSGTGLGVAKDEKAETPAEQEKETEQAAASGEGGGEGTTQ
ncbi:hypothetical protein JCM6882_004232 [Rhodosporidiobolus microsporus]